MLKHFIKHLSTRLVFNWSHSARLYFKCLNIVLYNLGEMLYNLGEVLYNLGEVLGSCKGLLLPSVAGQFAARESG